jgi:capsule polysaccharide export protein KpsE/RkpR
MQLMETLFDDYVKVGRFDLLEILVNIPLVEDFQVLQMKERIEGVAADLLNNGSHFMDQFEAALKPAWCRAAIQKVRIKQDIAEGDFELALQRVDAFQDDAQRRALRLFLIKQLLAENPG